MDTRKKTGGGKMIIFGYIIQAVLILVVVGALLDCANKEFIRDFFDGD